MTGNVGIKARVQRIGSSLSGMVMPNIGAFIAWGLITALFIPTGWLPNEEFNKLVSPMLTYVLPLIIGFTGGSMVYDGHRGGVVGAIATIGVIVGSNIPMFLGAMIVGPLGGWVIRKWDNIVQPKIRQGFEMLVNNFSAGILGGLLALIGVVAIGPLVAGLSTVLQTGVDWIVNANLLPLANVFIEPAKILFLNNAINQGILTPLGIQQAAEAGKSILFLLEPNPGPGLGLLLAFMFFGKGAAKSSAPGAIIIQFLGGIHEIYFPYVLSKPALFLAVIGGGVSGTATFQLLHVGLKATPSPGSIFAILLMTPKGIGNFVGVITGVLVATVVSFVIAAAILHRAKDDVDIEQAKAETQTMKSEAKGVRPAITTGEDAVTGVDYNGATSTDNLSDDNLSQIKQVIFACEAGMGSSAMGASLLRDRAKKAGVDIPITNLAIRNLKADENTLVVTQNELADMASQKAPTAKRVAVDNFLTSPKYDEIIMNLKSVQIGRVDQGSQEEPKPEPSSDLTQISWVDVKHIDFIHHDQQRGSGTIAATELSARLEAAGSNVSADNVPIGQVTDDKSELVIVTDDAASNLINRYLHVQILKVPSITSEDLWQAVVEQIEKGVA